MRRFLPRLPHPYGRAPVLGACFGALIVLSAIALSAHNLLAFFSLGGLFIVVGGVMAVAFMSFPSRDVHAALLAIRTMLHDTPAIHGDLKHDIKTMINWAILVKERGMRELETSIPTISGGDAFVTYGLNMVVSEYAPKELRAMMKTAADVRYERDCAPVDVLRAMASHAPAFGMVGTLVGMVAMLCNLSDNIAGMGSTLAVAFLSTLYGVLSARMVYMPAATRLQHTVEQHYVRHHLFIEGLSLMAAKKSPMYLQDRLNGFLRPEAYDYFDTTTNPVDLGAKLVQKRKVKPAAPHLKAVGA